MMQGFVKVGVASPPVSVGDPRKNIDTAVAVVREAEASGAQVLVFPELFITGYTVGDLFGQDVLLKAAQIGLAELAERTRDSDLCFVTGVPLAARGRLFNCAAAVQSGRVLGVVPKIFVPNRREYYERRWFDSGRGVSLTIEVAGEKVPFGSLLFELGDSLVMGIEICEDLWAPVPPSSTLAIAGANLIVNPSASNELVAKHAYRRKLVEQQSARCMCAYAYASSGVHESTTDSVFSGACLIAENGRVLAEGERFLRKGQIKYACVDIEALSAERRQATGMEWSCEKREETAPVRVKGTLRALTEGHFERRIDPYPFVPSDPCAMEERCREILDLQAAGLAKRLEHVRTMSAVLGLSGGLDSTLALLVTVRAFRLLGYPPGNITGVTMPGFGTTKRTYDNAIRLMELLSVTKREVDITKACLQHFSDIGHDPEDHGVTFENAQARERTQVLMDIANKTGGIVVGTADLSELALGWATFNGDHMSMYGVNASVPKTLVRYLVRYEAGRLGGETEALLNDVLDTPVSPELLPPDKAGNILQRTEERIGPYALHDFFLYHMLRFGTRPKKLLFLACRAFGDEYTQDEIIKWLGVFLERFFFHQYKRSSLPDGPKIGTVSLSPRGDWRMPSDADGSLWLDDIGAE
ncbi:MAG: NAD(+) synthase [Christensenellales bacterium]|jgi:NAD+ synthase (glutamine-hydrolysing)